MGTERSAFTPGLATVACEPKEAGGADQAVRMAKVLAAPEARRGAIALSPTGDPNLGDFDGAVILATVGEVDEGLAKLMDEEAWTYPNEKIAFPTWATAFATP